MPVYPCFDPTTGASGGATPGGGTTPYTPLSPSADPVAQSLSSGTTSSAGVTFSAPTGGSGSYSYSAALVQHVGTGAALSGSGLGPYTVSSLEDGDLVSIVLTSTDAGSVAQTVQNQAQIEVQTAAGYPALVAPTVTQGLIQREPSGTTSATVDVGAASGGAGAPYTYSAAALDKAAGSSAAVSGTVPGALSVTGLADDEAVVLSGTVTDPTTSQVVSWSHTVDVAAAGGGDGGGLTAPTTAYRINFVDEPTATWSGLAVPVTIDGVSGTYSDRGSTTFGLVNGQGWVIANTSPTTASSSTRFAGGQTNFNLAGNYTVGNLLTITWKVSGAFLDGANDIIVYGAFNAFGADGPGGSVYMYGNGTFDLMAVNNAGSSLTLTTSTATHSNPSSYYIRQVLDTAAGVARYYFSTTAPGTSTLSGGMTYLGATRSDVVRASSGSPLDAMPGAFVQSRFYRGVNTGTPMTATVEYIDVLELAV